MKFPVGHVCSICAGCAVVAHAHACPRKEQRSMSSVLYHFPICFLEARRLTGSVARKAVSKPQRFPAPTFHSAWIAGTWPCWDLNSSRLCNKRPYQRRHPPQTRNFSLLKLFSCQLTDLERWPPVRGGATAKQWFIQRRESLAFCQQRSSGYFSLEFL